jgi:hypothetical protein
MHGIDNWEKSTMQRNMMLNPNFSPQAALKGEGEQDEAAQERRRQERLKRKQGEQRQNGTTTPDVEGDPDVILEESKRAKRRKQKKQRPDLWSDDSLDIAEEELEDETERRRKSNRKREDWYDVWDE